MTSLTKKLLEVLFAYAVIVRPVSGFCNKIVLRHDDVAVFKVDRFVLRISIILYIPFIIANLLFTQIKLFVINLSQLSLVQLIVRVL